MASVQNRKEYRKSLTSSGQIYIGGEILDFISCDVSVKGIMVEVCPGKYLADIEDFDTLLRENNLVEIFVKELLLSGTAEIVWVKLESGKILLGLEYRDVRHNEEKLWLKRMAYRQQTTFSCLVIHEHGRVNAQGFNISIAGLALTGDLKVFDIEEGDIVKLQLFSTPVKKAVAKIIWLNHNDDGSVTAGLQYLDLE